MVAGRDLWWHEIVRRPPSPSARREPMDSEDLLFLLYTRGTTGKPKGIVHTTGGYLTRVASTHTLRLRPQATRTSTGARPTSAG